jgi:hypothetical protein
MEEERHYSKTLQSQEVGRAVFSIIDGATAFLYVPLSPPTPAVDPEHRHFFIAQSIRRWGVSDEDNRRVDEERQQRLSEIIELAEDAAKRKRVAAARRRALDKKGA